MDSFNYQNLPGPLQTFERTFLDPRLSNVAVSQPPPQEFVSFSQKVNSESDQQFIDSWLLSKGKYHQVMVANAYALRKPPNKLPLHVARYSLKASLEIVKQLDEIQDFLRSNVETMSTSEWKSKTQELGNLRDELDKVLSKFDEPHALSSLQSAVKKRTKKRLNQKRRKLAWREELQRRKEETAQRHKVTDQWLENMKEVTERAKMEEKMKQDADCVLFEVTRKKSEARKQLSLIAALVKLRIVRDSMATQRGEKLSLEDRHAFGSVTEKLIRMWENALQQYSTEEQCLRVMLEHNASEDSKAAKIAKEKAIVEDWERTLFGPKATSSYHNQTYLALTCAERDLETFVAIRKSWDTFLVNSSNSTGSSIPIGWVMPPDTPRDDWNQYLAP